MIDGAGHSTDPPRGRPHYTFLLFALLLIIIWPIVFQGSFPLIGEILFTLIVVAGVLAIRRRRSLLAMAVLLGGAALISLWAQRFGGFANAVEARAITAVLFLLLVIVGILIHISRMKRVRFDTISGSLCVYLLLGMMWAHLYLLVQIVQFDRDPFSLWQEGVQPVLSEEVVRETLNTLIYFSFVTLTTLGYGDIAPTTEVARGLCLLEAITGQLYLIVMVSGLVGLHIAGRVEAHGAHGSHSDE